VRTTLANDPDQQVELEVAVDPAVLKVDDSVTVTATLHNANGFTPAHDVTLRLDVPDGLAVVADTPTSYDTLEPGGDVDVRWTVTVADGAAVDHPLADLNVTADYKFGDQSDQAGGVVSVLMPSSAPGQVYLSDLPFAKAVNGWGPVERDMNNGETAQGDGGPLVIGGVTYEKGLGTNSNADIEFDLGGLCTSFHSVIGIDDTMTVGGRTPSVVVTVFADDQLVFESGLIDKTSSPVMLDIAIPRPETLRLVVDDVDTFAFDRLDFADAQVTCGGS